MNCSLGEDPDSVYRHIILCNIMYIVHRYVSENKYIFTRSGHGYSVPIRDIIKRVKIVFGSVKIKKAGFSG